MSADGAVSGAGPRLLRLGILIFLFTCGALAAADLTKTRQAIAVQYAVWQAAYRKNDAISLLRLLTSDFVIVTESGTRISRAQYKKSLLSRKSTPDDYRIAPTKFAIRGNSAKVWSTESYSAKGSIHKHYYLDIWKRVRGKWLMQKSTTLREE